MNLEIVLDLLTFDTAVIRPIPSQCSNKRIKCLIDKISMIAIINAFFYNQI